MASSVINFKVFKCVIILSQQIGLLQIDLMAKVISHPVLFEIDVQILRFGLLNDTILI